MNQSCWSGDGSWFRRFSAISCFSLFSYSLNSTVIHRCLWKLLDCVPEGRSHWGSSAVINQLKAIHFQWELGFHCDLNHSITDCIELLKDLLTYSICLQHLTSHKRWRLSVLLITSEDFKQCYDILWCFRSFWSMQAPVSQVKITNNMLNKAKEMPLIQKIQCHENDLVPVLLKTA